MKKISANLKSRAKIEQSDECKALVTERAIHCNQKKYVCEPYMVYKP